MTPHKRPVEDVIAVVLSGISDRAPRSVVQRSRSNEPLHATAGGVSTARGTQGCCSAQTLRCVVPKPQSWKVRAQVLDPTPVPTTPTLPLEPSTTVLNTATTLSGIGDGEWTRPPLLPCVVGSHNTTVALPVVHRPASREDGPLYATRPCHQGSSGYSPSRRTPAFERHERRRPMEILLRTATYRRASAS